MKSWKTTLSGIMAIVMAVITMVAQPLLDGDPSTSANLSGAFAAVMAGVGLIFARDNNRSSEDAGIK